MYTLDFKMLVSHFHISFAFLLPKEKTKTKESGFIKDIDSLALTDVSLNVLKFFPLARPKKINDTESVVLNF